MNWLQRYRLQHYVRNSIWILPVFGMVAALVLVNCLHWIEERAGWQSGLDPGAALALFGTLAGSMLTFIVFLSSSLLLVVQLASAQLSPRIIVDIASKALSPAINDPTTAVLAIGQRFAGYGWKTVRGQVLDRRSSVHAGRT